MGLEQPAIHADILEHPKPEGATQARVARKVL